MKYKLLYVDAPWRFKVWDRETGLDKSPDAHYQTMDLEELMAMPVAEMAAKDSLLVLWTYDPMYKEAMQLGQFWGFDFVTVLFRWIKTTDGQYKLFEKSERLGFGTGYHTRSGGCEEC
jgi:N6-adenosine-specific RNA methylase IME4